MGSSQAVIIDDNNANGLVLSRLLLNEGLGSIQISNPAKVIDTLHSTTDVCVIFLDLEMPGLNGYEVLEQLKADSRFQSIPIVAHTVLLTEVEVALEKGFDGFLGKPLDDDKFPDQLARILNGEPVWETQ